MPVHEHRFTIERGPPKHKHGSPAVPPRAPLKTSIRPVSFGGIEPANKGAPMTGKPPTIADVARVAGVSVPTVSRVLTGNIPVAEKRRAQVLKAIEELGYRPNAAARALVSGRRSMIAILAANTSRYGYARTVEGIEEAARAAGYMVVITVVETAEAEAVNTAVDMVLSHAVAGVIVLDFDEPGHAAMSALPRNVPVVVAA